MKQCHQCQSSFEVPEQEKQFLAHISPVFAGKKCLIPEPTLCPRCRNQRRMAWRNDRSFYHRKCDLTGKQFISMYPPDTKFPVYTQDAWHGDEWNALDHGREFDFARPFFEQWAQLRDQVPHWGVAISNCENSDYCNYCTDEKNCYLDIAAEGNEDCYFDLFVKSSKNVVDCTFVYNSQLCYECVSCYDCYNLRYCLYCDNSSDCFFSFDLKGCKNCLFCHGLRNKEYCILNQQYSREEYQQKLAELRLGSHAAVEQYKGKWKAMMKEAWHRDMWNLNCENSTGDNLKNCKNTQWSFNASNCEDCRYMYDVLDAKDCQDMNYSLYDPEASYEIISTVGTKFSAFFMAGPYNTRVFYSEMCQSCSDCYGCVGLKRAQYCILNKQYSKEEYEVLVPKIIAHMMQTKEFGEFFPIELSPHGYDVTVAQEYMPLTQEEVRKRGWNWEGKEEQIGYQGPPHEVPDLIQDVDSDICDKVLICEKSGKPYRVIQQELKYYQKMGLPIPQLSPDQRHLERMDLRNPRSLYSTKCSSCTKSTISSYAADRLEKILCESCYLEKIK